jgi:GDP-D-mannose dehydratase
MTWQVPSDYVLATGRTTSVRLFVEAAFRVVGITIRWRGHGVDEVGFVASEAFERIVVRPPSPSARTVPKSFHVSTSLAPC